MTVALGQFTYAEPQNQADIPTGAQLCWRGLTGKPPGVRLMEGTAGQSFFLNQQLAKLFPGGQRPGTVRVRNALLLLETPRGPQEAPPKPTSRRPLGEGHAG